MNKKHPSHTLNNPIEPSTLTFDTTAAISCCICATSIIVRDERWRSECANEMLFNGQSELNESSLNLKAYRQRIEEAMSNYLSVDFVDAICPYLLCYVVPSILMQFLINAPCSIFRLMDNFTGLVEFLPGAFVSSYWLFDSSKNFLDGRSILMNTCVMLWSMRLGGFLLSRMFRLGPLDSRIDNLQKKSGRRGVLLFWFVGHGLWSVICTSPVILVNALSSEEVRWTLFDLFGFSLWTIGFLMESLADQQKFNGKCRGEKRYYQLGRLWHYTRNPNHCGEIFCWLGLSLVSLNLFFFHPLYQYHVFLLIFSQLGFVFTLCVMLFEASLGSERKNNERYLSDRSYRDYRDRTSLLWPISPHLYLRLPRALKKTLFFQWDIYNQQETTLAEKKKEMSRN